MQNEKSNCGVNFILWYKDFSINRISELDGGYMIDNSSALISLIIPVYNVENYIARCIKSLKRQTYTNYEAIIVNDGSTDKSARIAEEIIGEDSRFKILNKTNGGLSSARNYGLDHIRGRYLTFVDSDDYVSENYLENLYKAITENKGVDIAVSRIIDVDEDGKEISSRNETKKTKIVSSQVMIRKMMVERNRYNHCAYGKLYKSDLWSNFRFPYGRLYEDYLTTYMQFSKVENIVLIDSQDYFYVQQQGSIMHMPISEKTLSILDVSDEVTKWISDNNRELLMSALELQMATYLKILQKIYNNDKNKNIEQQNRIRDFIKKYSKQLLLYRYTPFRDRIKIILFNIDERVFINIYNSTN